MISRKRSRKKVWKFLVHRVGFVQVTLGSWVWHSTTELTRQEDFFAQKIDNLFVITGAPWMFYYPVNVFLNLVLKHFKNSVGWVINLLRFKVMLTRLIVRLNIAILFLSYPLIILGNWLQIRQNLTKSHFFLPVYSAKLNLCILTNWTTYVNLTEYRAHYPCQKTSDELTQPKFGGQA